MHDYSVLASDMQDDRKIAARFILNFEAEQKQYDKAKRDYLERQKHIVEKVGGKGNMPGNPTQAAAIRSAQYDIDNPDYLWLKAVEIALRTFGERKRIFISVRQEAAQRGGYNEGRPGRRAWVVYTQRRYSEEIGKRFLNANGWMSDKTIRLWWSQVLDCIVEIHLRLSIKK